MRKGCLAFLVVAMVGVHAAQAAGLAVALELPRLEVAEYHRPYVAIWIECEDQSVAKHLAVWYEVKDGEKATRWLPDLRQWWRRGGRDVVVPLDGVSGATRAVGRHRLEFDARQAPLAGLEPGSYTLVVEAARESGGREAVRIAFDWPARARSVATTTGTTELGTVGMELTP